MYSHEQLPNKSVSYYLSLPSYWMDRFFRAIFYWIGYITASAPILFIVAAVLFTGGIGVGIMKIQLITDPQSLWVSIDFLRFFSLIQIWKRHIGTPILLYFLLNDFKRSLPTATPLSKKIILMTNLPHSLELNN